MGCGFDVRVWDVIVGRDFFFLETWGNMDHGWRRGWPRAGRAGKRGRIEERKLPTYISTRPRCYVTVPTAPRAAYGLHTGCIRSAYCDPLPRFQDWERDGQSSISIGEGDGDSERERERVDGGGEVFDWRVLSGESGRMKDGRLFLGDGEEG